MNRFHLGRFREFLKKENVNAVYVSHEANIRYFSNFAGTNGSLFLSKKKGYLLTDARYLLVAKKVLPRGFGLIDISKGFEKPWKKLIKKYRVRKLGIEMSNVPHAKFLRLQKISKGIKIKDISEPLAGLRMQKSPEELRLLARAQFITDKIFAIIRKTLKKGMSEKEIAWKIETLAHDFGASDISFPPIVGINEHSASPHHKNTDRKLKKGGILLLDFGVIYKGYCSDMTRVLFSRTPASLEQKIYSIVLEAQETAEKRLHAGLKGHDVDAISRDIIKKYGYGKYFGHSLGHGVGLEIHELPNLSEKYEKLIPENSVVTVEPGIYLPGKFGVRLEDMGITGANGFKVLTKSPKAIQDVMLSL